MDFLRHIANPVINRHVELKTIKLREAVELKKALSQAEEKFKFSVYNGEPGNLANFLKSKDFEDLLRAFKSYNALHVLVEILEKAAEAYRDIGQLHQALVQALNSIKTPTTEGGVSEYYPIGEDLTRLASRLKNSDVTSVSIEKNALKARVGRDIELRVRITKKNLKLEVKISRVQRKDLLVALVKRAISVLEEISSA